MTQNKPDTPGPTESAEKQAEARIRAMSAKPARHERVSLSSAARWGLLATLVMIAAAWHRTFIEMWLRWFPAWESQGLTLSERLTEGDSYYTHGPLVPLTSLVIAYFIHMRVGKPVKRSLSASLVGWLMLAVFIGFHLLSASPGARVMFVSGFALIGVIGGLVLIWGGWPMARAYWLPVAFLVFMVPLPEVAITNLNFRLKFLAGNAAIWITNYVFGVPAILDGSYIYLSPDEAGVPKTMVIDSVCSGLRSLISLVWFASLFAMVCRARGLWRLVMLALSVPVAVLSNIVRITTLNVSAHYISVEVAGPGGWIHDLSGLLVFAIALAVLFGIEQIIVLTGKALKCNWSDPRLMGYLDLSPRLRGAQPAMASFPVLGVLAITAGLSVYWAVADFEKEDSFIAAAWVPPTLTIDGTTYTGQDYELDQRTLIILETPDYLYRRYFSPNRRRSIDLLIVFSANNRKGTHPPEVCIEGSGAQIVDKRKTPLSVPGVGDLDLQAITSQQNVYMNYVAYTYKCGTRYTPSFFMQQFWIFANGLMAGDTSGALVRFSAGSEARGLDSSKELVLAAARQLMPTIDRELN